MSHMAREAAEAPEAVARFLDRNSRTIGEIGARLRARQPPVIITSARGSSTKSLHAYATGKAASGLERSTIVPPESSRGQ